MAGKAGNPVAHAVDPAGHAVALSDAQLQTAQENDFQPISAEAAKQIQHAAGVAGRVEQKYGTIGKALAGVGSGLTLGLGPAALKSAGMVDREELEALQETGAYQVGDIAGMVAPAFLTGGEALAARGAATGAERVGGGLLGRALGWTPAGLMTRAGGQAEALAGRLLPEAAGVGGKMSRGAIQMAARGASEGAIVNLAHTTSDAYIQDKPLTAQMLAASGVNGLLMGGLAGGILGGAVHGIGAGADSLAGTAISAGAARGERGAAVALKRLGATKKEIGEMALKEGGLVKALKDHYSVLQDGGESLASTTSAIAKSVKSTKAAYEAASDAVIDTLDREAANSTPSLERVRARIQNDLNVKYQGTVQHNDVQRVLGGLNRDLDALGAPVPRGEFTGKPPVFRYGDHPSVHTEEMAQYTAAKAAHDAIPEMLPGPQASWSQWAKSRDGLADMAEKARGGIHEDVYRTALNAFDDEIRTAMKTAAPDMVDPYTAAMTARAMAAKMEDMTAGKLGRELHGGDALALTGGDLSSLAYVGAISGHPIGAAAIVAGKKLAVHMMRRAEPAFAEASYRMAIGAEAAKASVDIGNRISGALRKFLGGTRAAGQYEAVKVSGPKYNVKAFNDSMDTADRLTSAVHRQKVEELASALATAGHPELGREFSAQYMRATEYVNFNRPADKRIKQAGGLGRQPLPAGIDSKAMKFINQLYGLNDPVGAIVNGLETGNISRVTVNAIKYAAPDLHKDVVYRASQEILAMKEDGKFLPADKIATLGTILDAPIDSKLEKGFIDEVQKAHVANNKPNEANGGGGDPMAMIPSNDYKTPLQTSAG